MEANRIRHLVAHLQRFAFLLCASHASAQSIPVEPAPLAGAEEVPRAAAEPAPEQPEAPARVEVDDDSDAITVVGTRLAETAGSAHLITDAELSRFEYDDPTKIFLSVPGVYARGEDGVGMRNNIGLRGVNPDRSKKITLLEDGVLFAPAPYSAPAAYYFPLVTRMVGVEVLKGPAAISHGPYTIAGAINLRTREVPTDLSAMADIAAGEYGYGKVHVYAGGTTGDNLGFLLEGVHLRNSGFKHLPDSDETGSVRNEWMGRIAYLMDPTARIRNEFNLKVTYSDEDADETYLGLTDEDFRRDPLQRFSASELDHMRAHRTSLVLRHQLEFSPQVSLTTNVYHHHYYRSWRRAKNFETVSLYDPLVYPTDPRYIDYVNILRGTLVSNEQQRLYIGPNERDFYSTGIETRLRAEFASGPLAHQFAAGVRLHHDSVDRRHSEDAYDVVGGKPIPAGLPTRTTTFEQVGALALSLFASDAVKWGPLTLTPGARVELIQFKIDNHLVPPEEGQATKSIGEVMPGIGAYLSLFDGFGVLAGISRGFTPPAPPTRAIPPATTVETTPLEASELSVNYEFGARFMRPGTRIEAIGFLNEYSNLTDICTASSGCSEMMLDQQFSAGAARIYGLEGFFEHRLRLGPVQVPVTVSYTYTNGTFQSSFFSADPIFGMVSEGDYMPYLPDHQVNASVAVESELISGTIGLLYMSPMREKAGQEPIEEAPVRTDEQVIFDVGLSVHFNEWWSVYGNLRNVFNEFYITGHRPFGARPNAPRWLQVGTKVTY
jgi:Fe(3+) dicitrate transport protein